MKGVIILPEGKKSWISKIKVNSKGFDFSNLSRSYAPFYYAIQKIFDFELRYSNEVDVDSDTDIVFMLEIQTLSNINKNTKLIVWPGDIHRKGIKSRLEKQDKVLERSDLIITTCYDLFVKMYPQYLSKYKFMPFFFAPHERYTKLPYNKNPKMRCLQTGATKLGYYPLRHFIMNNAKNVDYKRAVGDKFAKLLNSYFCCVNPSGIYNSPVAKCFEIPAAGTLLLTNKTSDLKKVGFVANKHYVPISQKNVLQTITHCLSNPTKYEHIRKEGMEYVHKNHSVNNRIEMFKTIFEELLK